jgi:hypothetical protein
MVLLCVDESDPPKKKIRLFGQQSICFVIVGAMLDDNFLISVDKEICDFKKTNGIKNLKELRKDKRFKGKALKLTAILNEILRKYEIKILAAVIGRHSITKDFEDNYYGTLTFILERFFLTLKSRNENGLVISDAFDSRREGKIKIKVNNYLLTETVKLPWKEEGRLRDLIYPSLLFVEDEHSNIIQISDLICTSLQSAVINYLKSNECYDLNILKDKEDELPNCNPYLKIYWDLFVKNSYDKVGGWGIKIWA